MDDIITVAICNYNTSDLTNACLKSLKKQVKSFKWKAIVLDNSDKEMFRLDEALSDQVKVLDNTSGKYIEFKNRINAFGKSFDESYGSMKHSLSIQFLLNICQTELMLLLDVDVIIKKDIDFIDSNFISIADVSQRKTYKPRALPYIQLFNVKMINEQRIHFFDPTRIRGGLILHNSALYDTGASFLEDITMKRLPFKKIDFTDYVFHLRSASFSKKDHASFIDDHKQFFTDEKNNSKFEFKVIVSLTSWEKRIADGSMIATLKSIISQKFNGKMKIALTLTKTDQSFLTEHMKQFIIQNNIDIITADEDLKPHKKYFYAMKKWRHVPIITIDDDVIYDDDLVQSLYDSWKEFPDCVSARRTHKMTRDSNGHLLTYRQWEYEQKKICKTPLADLFATGVGGVIYPEDCLKMTDQCLGQIRESLNADDVFLKKREQELGVLVVKAVGKRNTSYTQQKSSTADYSLCFMNNTRSRCDNDIYIKRLNLK